MRLASLLPVALCLRAPGFSLPWLSEIGNMPWMKGLVKRADCKTEKVEFGDSCESLAKKCGISGDDFTKYNNNDTCSTLAPGGIVYCSEGDFPDIRPKPESNGTCASYVVSEGLVCQHRCRQRSQAVRHRRPEQSQDLGLQ